MAKGSGHAALLRRHPEGQGRKRPPRFHQSKTYTAADFDSLGTNPFHLPTALWLDAYNKVLVTAHAAAIAARPSLKFNASTGAFTGKFTFSQSLNGQTVKRTLKIAGVLRQPPSTEAASAIFGAGCFELLPTPKTNETRFDAFHFEHAVVGTQ